MTAADPVDLRLLALLAEVGRVAVHDLAARAGMDAREVAARLSALAATGLPLVVGVECDQAALRFALARLGRAGQPGTQPAPYGTVSGPHAVPPYPPGPPSGPQPVYQGSPQAGPNPAQGGSARVPTGPSGPVTVGPHSGPQTVGPQTVGPQTVGPQTVGPHSGPQTVGPQGPQSGPTAAGPHAPSGGPGTTGPDSGPDPVGTWGVPQTAAWARGDQGAMSTSTTVRTVPSGRRDPARRSGVVGEVLQGEGLDGERVSIQLLEVVDPADFLFTAAGYRLQPGERSVVVHTELTNRGAVPFSSLPDLYLLLVDVDGGTVSKAPVSLSSRPPHRIGVQPGETAGGHTVYVLPEDTELASVRWSPRPDDDSHALTWSLPD